MGAWWGVAYWSINRLSSSFEGRLDSSAGAASVAEVCEGAEAASGAAASDVLDDSFIAEEPSPDAGARSALTTSEAPSLGSITELAAGSGERAVANDAGAPEDSPPGVS